MLLLASVLMMSVVAQAKISFAIVIGDSLSSGFHPDPSSLFPGNLILGQDNTIFTNGNWVEITDQQGNFTLQKRFGPPFPGVTQNIPATQEWYVVDDQQNVVPTFYPNGTWERSSSPVYGWSYRIRDAYTANQENQPSEIYAIQLAIGNSHAAAAPNANLPNSWYSGNTGVDMFLQLVDYHVRPRVSALLDYAEETGQDLEFIGLFGSIAGAYIQQNSLYPGWLFNYTSDLNAIRTAIGNLFSFGPIETDSFPFILTNWHTSTNFVEFPVDRQRNLRRAQLTWQNFSPSVNNLLVNIDDLVNIYGLDPDGVHYTELLTLGTGTRWAEALQNTSVWSPTIVTTVN
jgi:hypothetical protein